jgi:hypothetical protein
MLIVPCSGKVDPLLYTDAPVIREIAIRRNISMVSVKRLGFANLQLCDETRKQHRKLVSDKNVTNQRFQKQWDVAFNSTKYVDTFDVAFMIVFSLCRLRSSLKNAR